MKLALCQYRWSNDGTSRPAWMPGAGCIHAYDTRPLTEQGKVGAFHGEVGGWYLGAFTDSASLPSEAVSMGSDRDSDLNAAIATAAKGELERYSKSTVAPSTTNRDAIIQIATGWADPTFKNCAPPVKQELVLGGVTMWREGK